MFNFQSIDKLEAKKLSPQILAFVGDGVYSLFIRQKLTLTMKGKCNNLHNLTTNYVKAKGQSNSVEKILPLLKDEELEVFKRGRNYKTNSVAKHSTLIEYKRATGFECLIGYLYLIGQDERLIELLNLCEGEKSDS